MKIFPILLIAFLHFLQATTSICNGIWRNAVIWNLSQRPGPTSTATDGTWYTVKAHVWYSSVSTRHDQQFFKIILEIFKIFASNHIIKTNSTRCWSCLMSMHNHKHNCQLKQSPQISKSMYLFPYKVLNVFMPVWNKVFLNWLILELFGDFLDDNLVTLIRP